MTLIVEGIMGKQKPSDADLYNNYVVTEIERGHDPDSFFDWYMNKYHGHVIESIKKKNK